MSEVPLSLSRGWVLTITRIFRIRIRVITFLVKSMKKAKFWLKSKSSFLQAKLSDSQTPSNSKNCEGSLTPLVHIHRHELSPSAALPPTLRHLHAGFEEEDFNEWILSHPREAIQQLGLSLPNPDVIRGIFCGRISRRGTLCCSSSLLSLSRSVISKRRGLICPSARRNPTW